MNKYKTLSLRKNIAINTEEMFKIHEYALYNTFEIFH